MSVLKFAVAALAMKPSAVEAATSALRGSTPCDQRRWHHDIDNPARPGCSNSWRVPSSWLLPAHEDRMFFASYDECCSTLFEDGECNITDLCDETTPQEAVDDHCAGNPKWHIDLDTKRGCTNNPRYPDDWIGGVDYFFDTSEGCCARFIERGGPCPVVDICGGSASSEAEEIDLGETFEASQNVTSDTQSQLPLYHA